ncbi:hypothetical protein SOASR030_13550 [Leminorella grimontii]|uniref:Autotransporter domain-containing protein n=1 Tax=Leminorella grimontii TaxID=82981 RepID=A0AAV5MZG7_9GAMM|nr:AIDA repeat-containing protein [Leminorella grimontii]KFC97398.1 adhesin AIDA-I [Leminorella grimontii ATCC 33999 = DSM 5078]GKX55243.1 hypothetical protein SOASR030_13550 [Leminorella grimontii]VFS56724.1 Fluffing protein [Leminorella grimontii]
MKRTINTNYRLVWNSALGIFIAVSELAKANGKKAGLILSLAVAGMTVGPTALAADTEIPNGEVVNGATINAGDSQTVYGQVINTTILGDGEQSVKTGGRAENTTITGDGYQSIDGGGQAIDTTVTGMASDNGRCMFKRDCGEGHRYIDAVQELNDDATTQGSVPIGATAQGTILNAGGHQFIEERGVASTTIINADGYQEVLEQGIATDTTINAGGAQGVINGGYATRTIVGTASPDSTPTDTAYQIVAGNVITDDGTTVISTAENTTINNGGFQFVSDGATIINSVVNQGGRLELHQQNTEFIFDEGDALNENALSTTAKNVTINAGGTMLVSEGTQAFDTTISDGGEQYVNEGGTADRTIISGADGQQFVGGIATNTIVSGRVSNDESEDPDCGFDCSDGHRYVISEQSVGGNGVATGTILNAGGWQFLYGGSAIDTTINADGYQEVNLGGTATGTIINERGAQGVISGSAIDTTIGVVTSDVRLQDIAYQVVLNTGSLAENTTINNGGVQLVAEGGAAKNSIVNYGGRLELRLQDNYFDRGEEALTGTATDVTVNNGSTLDVGEGTSATNVTMNAGSALITSTAADVSGTNRLGNFSVDSATGHATNVLLENGGRLDVLTDGTADNTTVDNGGTLAVASGGEAQNVTMNAGGILIANTGSTINGTNENGAFAIDAASGTASNLVLNAGSQFTVQQGGEASDTTVNNGGTLNVRNNSRLTGTTVLRGTLNFTSAPGQFDTLTVSNLNGDGGTINMSIRLDDPTFPTDTLVIDGGQATGHTTLNFTNNGDSGLGLATTGEGIQVVNAINGATTTDDAFSLGRPLQAGAYNYALHHGSADESWYLSSVAGYRDEVSLYSSLFAQSMDYDHALAGSYDQRHVNGGHDNTLWMRIQGGHLGYENSDGIAHGDAPESSGSYGFVQLGSDLFHYQGDTVTLIAGIYAAAGLSSSDIKNDSHANAGTVRDNVYSVGSYLTAANANGLWLDIVAQGSRHNLNTDSDNNSFNTDGWGWLGSLETGLPLNVTERLVLESQLQYIYQNVSLDDGHDSGGYVKFSDGSAQHIRAGIRFGNRSEIAFTRGTSSGNDVKRSLSELPINWWVRPSVIRTFSSDGDLSMGTATAGSNVTFTPSQNGTSLDLQTGIEAQIRHNVTIGVQGGYTRSVGGNSADGYNGQATLKIAF